MSTRPHSSGISSLSSIVPRSNGSGRSLLRKILAACWLALGSLTAQPASAGDDPPADPPDFKTKVLPIFEAKCIRCHGPNRRGGRLDMQTVEALLKGGVSGPAIKPGNAAKSLMIEMIHYNEMPPKKESPRVSKEELELLRAWVNSLPKPAP